MRSPNVYEQSDPCKCGHSLHLHDLTYNGKSLRCGAMILDESKYEEINGNEELIQYGSFCACYEFNIEPLFFVASYAK